MRCPQVLQLFVPSIPVLARRESFLIRGGFDIGPKLIQHDLSVISGWQLLDDG